MHVAFEGQLRRRRRDRLKFQTRHTLRCLVFFFSSLLRTLSLVTAGEKVDKRNGLNYGTTDEQCRN